MSKAPDLKIFDHLRKLPDLTGKKVAIVAMGKSNDQYIMAKTYSVNFDEVWAINVMAGIIYHDRAFMMDPACRFLDSEVAGDQTSLMRAVLKQHKGPIYTCELDKRCPGLVEYPLEQVVNKIKTWYLNNTVAYAIAFAIASKVKEMQIYGIDFSYKNHVHFAEAGRACCEFLISKAIEKGIRVGISGTSSLLDTNVPFEQKLYGYHRLDDPPVFETNDETFRIKKSSQINKQKQKVIDTPSEAIRL